MTDPSPVYMGQLAAMKTGDIVDQYLDIAADLAAGETVASVTFVVKDAAGATVAGVVGTHTETSSRTDFRITAPAAGAYTLTAVFVINDGQKITRNASMWVV